MINYEALYLKGWIPIKIVRCYISGSCQKKSL